MHSIRPCVRFFAALTLPVTLVLPLPAVADAVIVVPGKYAGHLYAGGGASGDNNLISLAVFKLGSFTDYRIESVPAGYLCDTNCGEKAIKIKGGAIALKIVGNKPVPGVSIPLTGRWQAPCENITSDTDTCEIKNLTALNAQVRVTVDPTVAAGTIVPLPEGGEAMLTKIASDHILVADHLNPGALGKPLLRHDPGRMAELGLNDMDDGRNNMAKLVAAGSEPAIYCQGRGNGWYLPAKNEVATLTTQAIAKVSNGKGGWSSSDYSFEYKAPSKAVTSSDEESWKYKAWYNNSSNAKASDTTVYEYKLARAKNSTTWTVSKDSVETDYQALCFRRLPLQ